MADDAVVGVVITFAFASADTIFVVTDNDDCVVEDDGFLFRFFLVLLDLFLLLLLLLVLMFEFSVTIDDMVYSKCCDGGWR